MTGGHPASPRPTSFDDPIAGSDALINSSSDIGTALCGPVAGNLTQKSIAGGKLSAEALQEPLEALSAFRTGGVPCSLRQGRRDGHPEADEEGQGFPKDGEILVEPLDLTAEPVEPP